MASLNVQAVAVQLSTGEIIRHTQPRMIEVDLGKVDVAAHYGNMDARAKAVISLRPSSDNKDAMRSADMGGGVVKIFTPQTKAEIISAGRPQNVVTTAFSGIRRAPCRAYTPANRSAAPQQRHTASATPTVTRRSSSSGSASSR